MKSRAILDLSEIRVGSERFGAGLLDESQRLRAREKREAFLCESGTHEAVRQISDRLDSQVRPRIAGAGETLRQLVADRKRGREENLLFQRMLAADARQLLDETHPRRFGVVGTEGEKWLEGHRKVHSMGAGHSQWVARTEHVRATRRDVRVADAEPSCGMEDGA